MAQNTPSHIPESRLSNLIRSNEYVMSLNQGMDTVASELGIRQSFLDQVPNLGTPLQGDKFTLTVRGDGTGTLRKTRINPQGKVVVNETFLLTKEAIYQNYENDPTFSNISYIKSGTGKYLMTFGDSSIPAGPSLFIAIKNLDAFKSELASVGPAFRTQCFSRNEQYKLMCEVSKNKDFPGAVNISKNNLTNGFTRFFSNFFSESVGLSRLASLIEGFDRRKDDVDTKALTLGRFLAQSFLKQESVYIASK